MSSIKYMTMGKFANLSYIDLPDKLREKTNGRIKN